MTKRFLQVISMLCITSILFTLSEITIAAKEVTTEDTKKVEKLPETGYFSGNPVGGNKTGDISIQATSLPYNFSFWDVTTRIYSKDEFKVSSDSVSITCTAEITSCNAGEKPTNYNITLYRVTWLGEWINCGTKSYPYDERTTKTWKGLESGNYKFMIEKDPVNDGCTIEGEGTVKELN